jgi:ABC-2 type transport system ATP-binding protein
MTATGTAVRVRGLRKIYRPARYREVAALNGLDLDIGTGEIVALLGPNGAGKTTTVQILTGFRRRDAGEVTVLGTDPAAADRAWRARLGIVPQQASDFGELTVSEVVRHLAGYYPDPHDCTELIDAVGLTGQASTRLRRLSGGQRRRVDLALGLLGHPELLVLDEPTTGLDPAARRQFWGLIRQLAAAGTTVLLSTHYLDEAEALASRVAVMAAGRIVAAGPPATLAGRDTGTAIVSWQEGGVPRSERTPAPARLVAALAARAAAPDGEIPGLTVTRPSLEDTYLRLIGVTPHRPGTPEDTP